MHYEAQYLSLARSQIGTQPASVMPSPIDSCVPYASTIHVQSREKDPTGMPLSCQVSHGLMYVDVGGSNT